MSQANAFLDVIGRRWIKDVRVKTNQSNRGQSSVDAPAYHRVTFSNKTKFKFI